MRAMRQLATGEPLVLVEDAPEPEPGSGDVLVTVRRASVNPLDVWISAGTVAGAGPLPRTAGVEAAGVTADGRRVHFRGCGLGLVRDGVFAERVAVPEVALTPIPDAVTDTQAAGAGIGGVTALDVIELGDVGEGTTVLVTGASGGVGSFAVQLARARGARVIAQTSSEEHVAGLREIAETVVVAQGADLADAVRAAGFERVEVVLDCLGGPYGEPAARLLEPGGRLVVYGASAGPSFSVSSAEFYRKRGRILGYGGIAEKPEELARKGGIVLAQVASGAIRSVVAAELPLAEANEAFLRIRERRAGGKILLVP
jgi:NADPH2:quinone reductase